MMKRHHSFLRTTLICFLLPTVASVSAQPIAAGPMVTNNVVLRTLVAGNPANFKKESYKFQFIEQIDNSKQSMIQNYKIVTLCGSTRFKEQFLEVQKRLTLEGYIVISVGLFGHSGDKEVWQPGTKEMLDDMHLRKIDLADEIFVINVDGYIGESTRREIIYAEKTGKKVNYLEK